MIFGWQAAARRFVRRHTAGLAGKKVAYFACALRLTRPPDEALPSLSIAFDPGLVSDPIDPGRLSLKERFTTTRYYLKPILAAAPQVRPLSVAFFNGKLELFRLKWWQAAFVMLIVRAAPGDFRNWTCIRAWAQSLSQSL
jgi:menaquinone-dependent protoporphyrinogen IX oxidase